MEVCGRNSNPGCKSGMIRVEQHIHCSGVHDPSAMLSDGSPGSINRANFEFQNGKITEFYHTLLCVAPEKVIKLMSQH